MDSDNSIDMVELMSKPQEILFDAAKKDGLTTKQIDIIVNLLTTKLNFAIYDELYNVLRSAKLWESLEVESRKWHLEFVWMFHSWERIPRHLGEIIKSAEPHYRIYSGASKKTWRELAEEIAPFKLEDAMRLPRYHAISIMWTNDTAVSLIAKMAKPPNEQQAMNLAHTNRLC